MSTAAAPRLLSQRRAGVLLHPTALRGAAGDPAQQRGGLGEAARGFIDWLRDAGFSIWQVLPLGDPGMSGSPYWSRSDMAGEPGMIDSAELPDAAAQAGDYQRFLADSRDWLEDFVLFDALARHFHGPWWEWPEPFRDRHSAVLGEFAEHEAAALEQGRRLQWHFDWQWRALRRHAHERGVHLFGDLPIYVAPDSVSTWAHREQFQLTPDGRPALLAGVPPDYFSADGQLWGNPLYNWEQAQRDGFAFWRTRLGHQLRRFDLVRIDHFRGLAAYWAVPAGARTAREGQWRPVPGHALFEALRAEHPDLPVVAEDLGLITPDVHALRRAFGLPGMRVLQFGFDGSPGNPHAPHNLELDMVAYTGTHDNDTTVGWFRSLNADSAERVRFYLDSAPERVPDSLMRACLASVARLAMLPAQDLLHLDSSARFNTPGTAQGNWSWRLSPGALTPALAQHFRELNRTFDRLPLPPGQDAQSLAAASIPEGYPRPTGALP
jgi:4-alpha-glucanotransferase